MSERRPRRPDDASPKGRRPANGHASKLGPVGKGDAPKRANGAAARRATGNTASRGNRSGGETPGGESPVMAGDVVLHFVFPSDFTRMKEVQRQIISAVESQHFDEESLFAIKLALEEGLINAIKHGNKLDAAKTVTVDVRLNRKSFRVEIHDQGAGFDPGDVPDPLAEENLEKPSGRGLLLIGSYMDSVKYTDGGRCLTMVRKNQEAEVRG